MAEVLSHNCLGRELRFVRLLLFVRLPLHVHVCKFNTYCWELSYNYFAMVQECVEYFKF
jgi:hypothetical protein